MGNLLTSGNGKGNSIISSYWVQFVIIAALTGAWCFIFAPIVFAGSSSRDPFSALLNASRNAQMASLVNFFFWAGVILVPGSLLCAYLNQNAVEQTCINVYENGVEGKGVGKYWNIGDFRLYGFRLAYDQISSAEIVGTAVVIWASGLPYRCYGPVTK